MYNRDREKTNANGSRLFENERSLLRSWLQHVCFPIVLLCFLDSVFYAPFLCVYVCGLSWPLIFDLLRFMLFVFVFVSVPPKRYHRDFARNHITIALFLFHFHFFVFFLKCLLYFASTIIRWFRLLLLQLLAFGFVRWVVSVLFAVLSSANSFVSKWYAWNSWENNGNSWKFPAKC